MENIHCVRLGFVFLLLEVFHPFVQFLQLVLSLLRVEGEDGFEFLCITCRKKEC